MVIIDRRCAKCGGEIPSHMRQGTKFCGRRCRDAVSQAKRLKENPELAERRRKDTARWKRENPAQHSLLNKRHSHLKEHGHTDYIDNPIGNPKDRFRVARSLGFRSMLEYYVAKDLEESGVQFSYESMTIPYDKGGPSHGEESNI